MQPTYSTNHPAPLPNYVIYLPYCISGSTLTAVRRSQLLVRWPGTHSWILSGIQRAAQTVLGVYLKRTCSRVTSASSALGVLNDYALYKSTHSLTHSLQLLLPLLVLQQKLSVQEPFLSPNQQCWSPEVPTSLEASSIPSVLSLLHHRLLNSRFKSVLCCLCS